MGVETRCRPCHSTTHRQHMKMQPSLCHCCPRCGRHHCESHHHLRHNRQLRCHRRHHPHCCCRQPLPLRLPLTIAAVVSVASRSAIALTFAVTITLTVGHCHLCHHQPSKLPSPSAITIAVAVGHFRELLPWRGKNCIQPIDAKNAYLILFCSDSGWRTDQSQMTDQVSSRDGQH